MGEKQLASEIQEIRVDGGFFEAALEGPAASPRG
jgi:hypothetical protein